MSPVVFVLFACVHVPCAPQDRSLLAELADTCGDNIHDASEDSEAVELQLGGAAETIDISDSEESAQLDVALCSRFLMSDGRQECDGKRSANPPCAVC